MDGLWQKTSDQIRSKVGQERFETWFVPLSFTGLQGKTATIVAPNAFFRDSVKERFIDLLRQSFSEQAGETLEVSVILAGNGHARSAPAHPARVVAGAAQPRPPVSAQDRHSMLNPRYTFDEFVVGSGNQLAHAAALAVANQPGEKYNPLLIYGGVGLGKTHLVTAIGHHIAHSGNRSRKVLYLSSEVFMNELIGSLRRDKMGEFREKFRRVDCLILDDVQFLAGRERTQEEFFHTFNALHADRHPIVLTSDKLPCDIPGLEERLRNRFESGLMADINPPDLETRVAIVLKKAAHDDLRISQEVAMYIAQNVSTDVRRLEGCLTRLAMLSSLSNSTITVEFTREALQDVIRDHDEKPTIATIQTTVADFFHIKLAELKSKRRTQHIAFCRQVAMYLCRKLTDASFPMIGEQFSRDHSTVIHAHKIIDRRVTSDSAFRLSMEKIERELKTVRNNAA